MDVFLEKLLKVLLISFSQLEGDTEGLFIVSEDKQGKPSYWWMLLDTWSDEAQWVQGRVEIKPEVVEQDSEYRVSNIHI